MANNLRTIDVTLVTIVRGLGEGGMKDLRNSSPSKDITQGSLLGGGIL